VRSISVCPKGPFGPPEQLASSIWDAILTGELAEGQRLPSETALAANLDISALIDAATARLPLDEPG
jgi:hypothetical protein